MSHIRTFKQQLGEVARLWKRRRFAEALAVVDGMRREWPGNAHLQVQWAQLVQLGDDPMPDLDDARRALQQAVELDPDAPGPGIELGHFLDAVQDDPSRAAKVFGQAVASARHWLIEGLLGEARALLQLDRHEAALQCLLEALSVAAAAEAERNGKAPEILWRGANGQVQGTNLTGPFASQIGDLLNQILLPGSGRQEPA